jgi:hypothetical protein
MFNEEELEAICLFVKGKNKGGALNGDDILQINSALRDFNAVEGNDEVIDFEEYYQNCLSIEVNEAGLLETD